MSETIDERTELTDDEKNRKCAEWLGYRESRADGCLSIEGQSPLWHHPSCKCDEGDKCICPCGDEPSGCMYCAEDCAHMHFTECGTDLPDFLRDGTHAGVDPAVVNR